MEIWQGPHDENWDSAQEELRAMGWTDGLPVVPPTSRRVAAMIEAWGIDPEAALAILPPSYEEVSWRDIAINAVMAGCAPQHLPIVAAAVKAIAAPEFNLLGVATTTGSATACLIVNGPAAQSAGMNAAANAFGPGNRANATIGRALSLVLQNIGGARVGEIDMATLGQPAKYTFCFAENESESPWAPLHIERGYARDTSVVTAVGISGTIEVVDSESLTPEDLSQTFAQSMLIAGNVGGAGLLGGGEPLIVMPPEHAHVYSRAGWSKAQAKAAIFERAQLKLDRLAPAQRERALAGGAADGYLRVSATPDDVMIVVAGGVGRKGAYVPTWSGTTKAVSKQIGLL
jgi:hypothetical protein